MITTLTLETQLGPMLAAAVESGVCLLEFTDRASLPRQLARVQRLLGMPAAPDRSELLLRLADELSAYFAGRLRAFNVPLANPGTPFQQAVWAELGRIPYGETRTYRQIAALVGRPGAIRAVGTANGANPLAILVPCHRLVNDAGGLSGYGGGLWRKEALLALERDFH